MSVSGCLLADADQLVRGEIDPDQTLPKLDDPVLEPLHILHRADYTFACATRRG